MKKVLLVTGFLGSGKTTLINSLLPEILQNNKVAIIENEFGKAGIDTPILAKSGVKVKELLSGCICCTLQGEIIEAMRTLLAEKNLDWIIIEPSGVSKTSDILKTLKLSGVRENNIKVVNIVDSENFKEYSENFGNFFDNQIECARLQLIRQNKTLPSDSIQEIIKNLQLLSPCSILEFDYLNKSSLWMLIQEIRDLVYVDKKETSERNTSTVIEAWTTLKPNIKDKNEILVAVEKVLELHNKRILRLKGFIPSSDGSILHVQYKPNILKIDPINLSEETSSNGIVVIGEKLNHNKLNEIFEIKL